MSFAERPGSDPERRYAIVEFGAMALLRFLDGP